MDSETPSHEGSGRKFKRLLLRIFWLALLAGGLALGWHFRDPIYAFYQTHLAKEAQEDAQKPDPDRYQALIEELSQKRTDLAQKYAAARSAVAIKQVIQESRALLDQTLPELMVCWLGTPWDFNGTCRTPGSGKIACGYFVSTILLDAGFQVERFKLAQQPSQRIIGTFLPKDQMHIKVGMDYHDFVDQAIARGPGVRIVGLDTHVAFIHVTEDLQFRFLHSSGIHPKCVVDENRDNATALRRSNYRVTGDLTQSDQVIHGWLTGKTWKTKTQNLISSAGIESDPLR